MESPNKRLKPSPPDFESGQDFVSFGGDDEDFNTRFGDGTSNGVAERGISNVPRGPRAMNQQPHVRDYRNDPRHAKDKPKSKFSLPGFEPWVLVKTKYGRRFVHNMETKESLWHIPTAVIPGVLEFEHWELSQKEKEQNAKWAEEQLQEMRPKVKEIDEDHKHRRRRSESLQREDEAALMAELAAEAEHAEEQDVKATVKALEPIKPVTQKDGYGSDSSYEEVEVTDSEFDDDDDQPRKNDTANGAPEDAPVEFGEDDIAYQLAAMQQSEDEEYDDGRDYDAEEYDEDEGTPELTEEEATSNFHSMLTEHNISAFTPWEALISSDSPILSDERYTLLPNMAARKVAFSAWAKDTAASIQQQRAQTQKTDPKVAYLAFLAEEAPTRKLYWPEFKRKFKKHATMTGRDLSEKDREKIYREHVGRLKLPESRRKADLKVLLESISKTELQVNDLPERVRGHLHFISLPVKLRDDIVSEVAARKA